jgi:hypothetical protein
MTKPTTLKIDSEEEKVSKSKKGEIYSKNSTNYRGKIFS